MKNKLILASTLLISLTGVAKADFTIPTDVSNVNFICIQALNDYRVARDNNNTTELNRAISVMCKCNNGIIPLEADADLYSYSDGKYKTTTPTTRECPRAETLTPIIKNIGK